MADGDRDNDGVADELEVTVTFMLDGDGGAPADQREGLLEALEQLERDGYCADHRVHGG